MFHSFRLRERFRFRRLDNRPLFHFIMIINISNPYRNLALYWNTAISVCTTWRRVKINQWRKMASSFFV